MYIKVNMFYIYRKFSVFFKGFRRKKIQNHAFHVGFRQINQKLIYIKYKSHIYTYWFYEEEKTVKFFWILNVRCDSLKVFLLHY